MIVNRATRFGSLMRQHAWALVGAVLIVASVEIANDYRDVLGLERPVFSMAALGLLTTALSIFLVFRVNEAYSRWWEARILWGGIVNFSRTFARQATTLIDQPDKNINTDSAAAPAGQELVYRHLAYINALRLHLRRQSDDAALAEFLTSDEIRQLDDTKNKPTQLLQKQAERIAQLRATGRIDGFDHRMLDASLTELCNLQGACERIKNTVFPDRVAFFTRWVAWSLATMIPLCVLDSGNRFDIIDYTVVPAIMMIFIITERLGAELKNPFENQPNDTPMSTLCRSIEIDLRQQLGETELPEPLEPVNGVLL